MQLSLKVVRQSARSLAFAASFATALASAAPHAHADSAYVTQALGSASALSPTGMPMPVPTIAAAPLRSATMMLPPPPEAALAAGTGQNIARTLEIGAYNQVAQIQLGRNDRSNVGVIGSNNKVGVLQAGSNLRSNLVLLGTGGLNVGVLQPAGSAPVNMLIARLPNGGLLIKR